MNSAVFKSLLVAFIVFIVFIVILNLPVAATENRAKNEIRLGATIPLTGDFATYGNLIRDGIDLAIKELESEGFQVEVYYEDVNMPGPSAKDAIHKLITADKIDGVVANFLNPSIPVMAAEIEKNKIPTFHTAIADDLILEAGEHIFSTNAKIKDEAKQLARYAFSELGARTASILYISTTFGDNYAEHFREEFQKFGGEILLYDTTAIGQQDLRGILTRVKSSKPDVFFAAYFGTNMGVVLKQAGVIGLKTPILGVYETEDPSVLQTAGDSAESVRFFVPEPRKTNTNRDKIRERFQKAYGYKARVLATNAYDATMILAKSLSECQRDSKCALRKIGAIKDYHGASGTFSIDADGAATREFVLKTVRNGEFVEVVRNGGNQ